MVFLRSEWVVEGRRGVGGSATGWADRANVWHANRFSSPNVCSGSLETFLQRWRTTESGSPKERAKEREARVRGLCPRRMTDNPTQQRRPLLSSSSPTSGACPFLIPKLQFQNSQVVLPNGTHGSEGLGQNIERHRVNQGEKSQSILHLLALRNGRLQREHFGRHAGR